MLDKRKKMTNKEWIDLLSELFNVSHTTARDMLHILMKCKIKDNFKKELQKGNKC